MLKNFKKNNNKGFTLVELLVVIAIMGILAVVAVPSLVKNVKKASVAEVATYVSSVRSAALADFADTQNASPNVAEILATIDGEAPAAVDTANITIQFTSDKCVVEVPVDTTKVAVKDVQDKIGAAASTGITIKEK